MRVDILNSLLETGKQVLKNEQEGIANVRERLDDNFSRSVQLLHDTKGLVIVIGIGKSGYIGKKMAATFTSMGKRSIFLHPIEGQHGDLGIITEHDVCIVLSHSGNTEEVARIIPYIKKKKTKIIAITSNEQSEIAKQSDIFINTYVKQEADLLNLAPTSSSTVTLAIGDALAVALSTLTKLSKEDFALHHPGGMLGKKLLLTSGDIMIPIEDMVVANPTTKIETVLFEMTKKKMGYAAIVEDKKKIIGLITDGDIRRMLMKNTSFLSMNCAHIMHKKPISIPKETLATDALKIMKQKQITCLLIEDQGKLIGSIDLQEIARTGIEE